MIGSTVSTFANTQYKCCECSKNLGDKIVTNVLINIGMIK